MVLGFFSRAVLLLSFIFLGVGVPAAKAAGFVGCLGHQQGTVNAAIDQSRVLVEKALDNLSKTPSPNPLYSQWFGAQSPQLTERVLQNFRTLKSHLLIGVITAHCACPASLEAAYPGIFGAVHAPNHGITENPYNVYFCSGFFGATDPTGYNSRAGVVLHEMSHFDIANGTSDFCAGIADCEAKAKANPENATRSADSYEYFAESLF